MAEDIKTPSSIIFKSGLLFIFIFFYPKTKYVVFDKFKESLLDFNQSERRINFSLKD